MMTALGPAAEVHRRPSIRHAAMWIAGGLLLSWALASGYYIAFHDRMLAALLSHEAEMQYAYEDRIAELRVALEGAAAQTLRETQAQDAALRDLAARGAKLEVQADSLEALVGAPAGSGELRLHPAPEAGRRADRDVGETASLIATLEVRQRSLVDALRLRADHANARIQSALADLGLAPSTPADSATGGPFVPLAAGARTPEESLALLKDALSWRRRLDAVTARLPLRRPVTGPLEVTSGFGARRDPFYGRLALHTGIDLRQGYGSIVRSVAAGRVSIAGPESGYGTLVEIDHGNGYATRYAHLSSIAVTQGQKVGAGEAIGRVGTSGRSTGPHLHYEVRIAGEPVDPARYLELAASISGD